MKVVYFPRIFPLRLPVAVPDVLFADQLQVGLATVRMGFSEKISVVTLAILTSELESTEGIKLVGMPMVIIKGQFRHLSGSHHSELAISAANSKTIAEALVAGSGTPDERIQRELQLQSLTSWRADAEKVPLKVGSSIGTREGEDRRTVGLYLKSSYGKRVLTCAHVASPLCDLEHLLDPLPPYVFPKGRTITSPGRLDCLVKMKTLLRANGADLPNELLPWLVAAERICGSVHCGRLGADDLGYREDWALIELQDGFVGVNGIWWEMNEWENDRRTFGVQPSSAAFRGSVVAAADPSLGGNDIWFKDGASTGWTAGRLASIDVELFIRGSVMGVTDPVTIHPVNIIKAKVFMMAGLGDEAFATPGDSGSGVFKVTDDGQDVVFGGMVVSEFEPIIGESLTMVVPATRLLAQVAKETGVTWEVAID
jgi:hypothetical protein